LILIGVIDMKTFPDFDFKIDCGDDPKVRQWLHDNGVRLTGMLVTELDDKTNRIYVRKDSKRATIDTHEAQYHMFRIHKFKQINPYDYMQDDPAVKQSLTTDNIAEIAARDDPGLGVDSLPSAVYWSENQHQVVAGKKAKAKFIGVALDLIINGDQKYVVVGFNSTTKQEPTLTIPSICLRDPVMPMMLGGQFGALSND